MRASDCGEHARHDGRLRAGCRLSNTCCWAPWHCRWYSDGDQRHAQGVGNFAAIRHSPAPSHACGYTAALHGRLRARALWRETGCAHQERCVCASRSHAPVSSAAAHAFLLHRYLAICSGSRASCRQLRAAVLVWPKPRRRRCAHTWRPLHCDVRTAQCGSEQWRRGCAPGFTCFACGGHSQALGGRAAS